MLQGSTRGGDTDINATVGGGAGLSGSPLIDGEELAGLMVRHGIGVRTRIRHEIKRIDEDYFDQEAL